MLGERQKTNGNVVEHAHNSGRSMKGGWYQVGIGDAKKIRCLAARPNRGKLPSQDIFTCPDGGVETDSRNGPQKASWKP